ncbi:MAG: PEP/pyruvate-binding domain-containing protein, partial [Flavobacteriales bacterium]
LMIPPVAGIVTNEFQTPLSHVNMLAQSRNLPDAALRGVWNNARWKKLEGTLVKLHVTNDSVWVESTNEIMLPNKKKQELKLSPDITENRLADVKYLRIRSIDAYGGKASNMGELHRIKLKGMNLPEGAFGIPLYYYYRHARNCGSAKLVDSLLKDTSILNSREKTAAMLAVIRMQIRKFPVAKDLLDSITVRLKKYPQYNYFRFRSSTNAEDIAGFNGAGLYDSYSASVTDTAKKIENAIRKTWASLWNQRAFEERTVYGINHRDVGMGVLVHRAFGTEAANGVAITANIYRSGYPSFIINSQHGEASVVSPEPGQQCEQLILNHKVLEITIDEISIDYISRSSLNNGDAVLTREQLFELARCLFAIKEHFYFRTRYGRKFKGFLQFAMDVEFKIDSATGKLYIKQARPLEIKNEE